MVRLCGKIQLSFVAALLLTSTALAGGAIAGKVTIVKGQVFIIRGSEKIQVKKDITVLESDVIESQVGGTARITMIDSNLVDVYPKSKVEIAKYVYKPNQDKKDVELKVDFGKIKSTVNQKYDGAKNKFQVKTPSAVAGVRGTVFTAEYDASRKISKVVTIEGLVAVTKVLDRERQSPPVFVRPDQVVKVDPEQSKAEQPRDLKSEEREERQKEDKDLGYQYDPKKEPVPASDDGSSSKFESKDVPKYSENTAEPGQDIPVKEVKDIKETVRAVSEDRSQEQQERRQASSEDEQAKKQKQSEDEQAKKQKQSEDEQAKKQKQSEDEQAKKQKQSEDEQAKKQKQSEEEQTKKQNQLEEEQARKQKHAEDEQSRREEEQQKRAEKEAARRAEEASRLDEIAKRAEENIIRLPSGSDGSTIGTTPTNDQPLLTTPRQ